MEAPILCRPDFEKPFTIHADASLVGLGAILTQVLDGQEHVIAYASRAITEQERNYITTELECLAVIWALDKFLGYIEGTHVTVFSDHDSLRWLRNLKKPKGRLARWVMLLAGYDITIIHRNGALHQVPDALSRMFEGPEDVLASLLPGSDKAEEDEWHESRKKEVVQNPKKFRDWLVANKILYHRVENILLDAVKQDESVWKIVPPKQNRDRVLYDAHDAPQSGHLGIEKTYTRIAQEYFWPGMFKDVVEYVKHCEICQKNKPEQFAPAGLLGQRIIEHPWCTIATDIIGPLPRSKTGMVITRWGTPKMIINDNGTVFVNKVISELAMECKITLSTTPIYHAQANPVERVNRVLESMIRAFIDQDHKEWDHHINDFRFAFNTSKHAATPVTPAFLNFRREPLPSNSLRRELENNQVIDTGDTSKWLERLGRLTAIRDWVVDNVEKAHIRQAKYYNKGHRPVTYKIGDIVLMRNRVLSSATKKFTAKLAFKYKGP